ncbi:MAG: copper-binding protein [Thaumarchaeota archaeon]|nr:copper-binding protein [Nitrososphaerota archaeon]
MEKNESSHAYGIGIITIIVGMSVSIVFYQMYYIPESLLKPAVDEHILHPVKELIIEMIPGSANPNQQDNFVPKLVRIQLGIDNHVIWKNVDDTPHTVTPDHRAEDPYSGTFGSSGVVKAGEEYEFLFTEDQEIEYHCEPHPWMTGTLIITKQRF